MKTDEKKITVGQLTKGYVDDAENGVRGFGGKLDIRPPYQREFIYKDEQRDKVIDTVAKGYPLNSMYWAVRDDGNFEIIDGQQRTVSLCHYIDGRFGMDDLFDVKQNRYFHSLDAAEKKRILDYPLTVYQCSGEKSELLNWFRTINIAGEKLTEQELRNAVYSGRWVTDAKKYFSRTGCAAQRRYGNYLSGAAIRQKYLETAIKWISGNKIEEYMAAHQNDENARPLWNYFENVMEWTRKVFPQYRKAMEGIAWGDLHRDHQHKNLNAAALEKQTARLMADDDVKQKKGVYAYLLTGDEHHLNLRVFSKSQKATAYEKQGGKCANPKCGKKFDLKEMQADHIKPWSKGGKTESDNCQMLCRKCNARKSDK